MMPPHATNFSQIAKTPIRREGWIVTSRVADLRRRKEVTDVPASPRAPFAGRAGAVGAAQRVRAGDRADAPDARPDVRPLRLAVVADRARRVVAARRHRRDGRLV